MAKEKSKLPKKNVLDPLSFLHQPHDKYARFVLQTREVALEFIQFGLEPDLCAQINLDSLEVSDDSFVDNRLRIHFSDICYVGHTKGGKSVRISFIFEHKSEKPDTPIMEQLNRYIVNAWSSDLKQNRNLSLTIPILIYHGAEPLQKETPATLFPDAPEGLLRFVPSFDYILLDLCRISDEILEHFQYLWIRNIILALKYSRNEDYLQQNWGKVIIFAPDLRTTGKHIDVFQATVIYMSRTSDTFNHNIKYMDTVLSSAEQEIIKPYVIQMYEQALEKGLERGREAGREEGREAGREEGREEGIGKGMILSVRLIEFIKKNYNTSDAEIAKIFKVEASLVSALRLALKNE